MKKFTKNDWDHMHDCILDATWKTTKKNATRQELEEIFKKLPSDMQAEAKKWGMNDTVWRDNFIRWYKLNNDIE
jgi:hypothetical protein